MISQQRDKSFGGSPSSVAKTFIVPSGSRPSATFWPAIPFTISLIVPSPPAATIFLNPSAAAWRAKTSASPEREVAHKIAPRVSDSTRARKRLAREPRAAGLRMTTVSFKAGKVGALVFSSN